MTKIKLLVAVLSALFFIRSEAQITFTSQFSPTLQELLGISFADTSIGYVCGAGGTILKTVDGGITWTQQLSGTFEDLWDIKIIPNTNGQGVIACGDNNTIIKSTNGGVSWSPQTVPFQSGSFVFGLHCLDSMNYFACGGDFATVSGAILKTTNGGTTWTSTPVPGSVFLDKVFMLNSTTGFTVGTNVSFNDGSIHKTTNGTSFPSVKTSASIITNLWCISATKIVAVGLGGQIWKSIDAGVTWTSHSLNSSDLYGVQFTDSLNGFACGGAGTVNTILRTIDGGNTWSQIFFGFNGSWKAISIVDNKIYIAGTSGKIIKGTVPVSTGINEIKYDAMLVYPNPANDFINISFSEELLFSNLKFSLFDAAGRAIKTRFIEGRYSQIEIFGIESGIYFYQIIDSDGNMKNGRLLIK